MKYKFEITDKTRVWFDMCDQDSWFKHRKKVGESKCKQCGKLFRDTTDGITTLVGVVGQVNKWLCKACGEAYVKLGAIDHMKVKNKAVADRASIVKAIYDCSMSYKESSRWDKQKIDRASTDELKVILGKEQTLRAKQDYYDSIVLTKDDLAIDKYLETDYNVIQCGTYLKCADMISDYFRDDADEYFEDDDGDVSDEAEVLVKIAQKYYKVSLTAELGSQKQDRGDRTYWVECVRSVSYEEIPKPKQISRNTVAFNCKIGYAEIQMIMGFLDSKGIDYTV